MEEELCLWSLGATTPGAQRSFQALAMNRAEKTSTRLIVLSVGLAAGVFVP